MGLGYASSNPEMNDVQRAIKAKNLYQNHQTHRNFLWLSSVFELPGAWGVDPPTSPCRPLPLVKIRPREG